MLKYSKYRIRQNVLFIVPVLFIVATSCKKEWLEERPDISLVVPSSVADCQALLDNYSTINSFSPSLGQIASDEFYVSTTDWQTLPAAVQKNSYIWAQDVYEGATIVNDWDAPYKKVFYSNVVLDALTKVEGSYDKNEFNNVKGSALFHRAFAFYSLAEVFAKPYSSGSASSDLGIPIRLTPDINVKSTRATIEDTYAQIIKDLLEAMNLLPEAQLFKTRPTQSAAFALLARVYLAMEDYKMAGTYADSAMQANAGLLDYNTLINTDPTFVQFNDEVIFHSELNSYSILFPPRLIVDSSLYALYDSIDLRKTLFFPEGTSFRGSYTGSVVLFNGLATDEMYLIRAESRARDGDIAGAMDDLNYLRERRIITADYKDLAAVDIHDALDKIIAERRRELCFRGLRWTDLRRLNKYPEFATTLIRVVDNQQYTLAPNDNKYVFAIPEYEIRISGLQQNVR